MHAKVFAFMILFNLSTLLIAQVESNNILGGEFRVDRLSYEKSYDGVRKDIDLAINTKYLRSLFPIQASDSSHFHKTDNKQKPLSRHWAGISLGFSGYFVNSDSAITKVADISLGPIFRYYVWRGYRTGGRFSSTLSKIHLPCHTFCTPRVKPRIEIPIMAKTRAIWQSVIYTNR